MMSHTNAWHQMDFEQLSPYLFANHNFFSLQFTIQFYDFISRYLLTYSFENWIESYKRHNCHCCHSLRTLFFGQHRVGEQYQSSLSRLADKAIKATHEKAGQWSHSDMLVKIHICSSDHASWIRKIFSTVFKYHVLTWIQVCNRKVEKKEKSFVSPFLAMFQPHRA